MYKVNEIFYSLQGEGAFTGTPMIFVRFNGCNRACHFCDTDFSTFTEMSSDDILETIRQYPSRRVVLTGGEPMLQVDDALVEALHREHFKIHIETNGSLPVAKGIDWVTCSPKSKPWRIEMEKVDEIKIVYTGQANSELDSLRKYFSKTALFYLQPCSGENIIETVAKTLELPDWRLSLQTHKLINIQ